MYEANVKTEPYRDEVELRHLPGDRVKPSTLPRRSRMGVWPWVSVVLLLILVVVATSSRKSVSHHIRKAVVLSSYRRQNVTWTKTLQVRPDGTPDPWEVYRYVGDAHEDDDTSEWITIDNTRNREVLGYLTFIVDNYHDLPDVIIFTHGQERSWHQPNLIQHKLWALNITALYEEGYINIRCKSGRCDEINIRYYDGSKTEPDQRFIPFWQAMLEKQYGPVPKKIANVNMAQFATITEKILAQPHQFWVDLRDPLITAHAKNYPWREGVDGYAVGLYFEQVWHILFGKEPMLCPETRRCNDVFFSRKLRCDLEPTYFTKSEGWENNTCEYYEHGLPEGQPSIGPKNWSLFPEETPPEET